MTDPPVGPLSGEGAACASWSCARLVGLVVVGVPVVPVAGLCVDVDRSLALVVTMAPMPQAAAEPPPAMQPADEDREGGPKASGWLEPTGAGLVRPDWVSASLTARMTGKRVEVLAERSESGRTWVLPSGEAKQELSGVVRFQDPARKDDQGGWRDIDTTLAKVSASERRWPQRIHGRKTNPVESTHERLSF